MIGAENGSVTQSPLKLIHYAILELDTTLEIDHNNVITPVFTKSFVFH